MTLISLVGINFLLGITWVFVVLYVIFDDDVIDFIVWFLFWLFTPLQGFFIFFFFVVLNADARKAWKKLLCSCKKKAKPLTNTNNKYLVKTSNGGNVGTLSSTLPSTESAATVVSVAAD